MRELMTEKTYLPQVNQKESKPETKNESLNIEFQAPVILQLAS